MKNVYYILPESPSLKALVYFNKENKDWPKEPVGFLSAVADLFDTKQNFILKDFNQANEIISLLVAEQEYGKRQLEILKKINDETKKGREKLSLWDKIFENKNWEDLIVLETKRAQEDLKELDGLVHFYAEIDWAESNEMEIYTYIHSNEELAVFIEEIGNKIGIRMSRIEDLDE